MVQNSVNQHDSDQGNSNISSMGDSAAITIEFLRARLLTERSVSKAAKQRSDELAKRVLELEEQLKLVTLQRKKAEKAATNVLSILESRGVSEFSEEFDSGSELDETLPESKINNNLSKEEESSVSSKTLHDDSDESENAASLLSGRSLSWNSGRGSSSSREKCMDSSTRKQGTSTYRPFVPSSSRRRAGKSCRQIQRKEIRSSVEDSQINGSVPCPEGDSAATSLEGFPSNSEIDSNNYRQDLRKDDLQVSPGILQSQKHEHKGSYQNGHESNKGMEKALKYQTQFIGQYEEEEKAQREWEEKFRENNNNIPNAGEPGSHSDVSEEKGDTKEHTTLVIPSTSQEANSHVKNSCLANELTPEQSNCLPVNVEMKESEKCQNVVPKESLVSEFSIMQGNQTSNDSTESSKSAFSSQLPEPQAIVPHASSSELGSVLGALTQAKLSLQHKVNSMRPLDFSPPVDIRSQMPFGCSGLFRVPSESESELEYGMRTNSAISSDSRPRSINNYHNPGGASFSATIDPFAATTDPFLYRNLNLNPTTRNTSEITRQLAMLSPNNKMQHEFHPNNNTMVGGETQFNQGSSRIETRRSVVASNSYGYPAIPLNPSYTDRLPSMYYPPNSR